MPPFRAPLVTALLATVFLATASVAATGALGADLPTRKAAPADALAQCTVGSITGWLMPGTNTCMKISGNIEAQVEGGPLSQQWTWSGNQTTGDGTAAGRALGLIPGQTTWSRDSLGWTTRLAYGLDFASDTPQGPLIGHMDYQYNTGNGFDSQNENYVNLIYVSWAGLTAGRAASYFSYFAGGDNWANIFSPDRQQYNQPALLAYTAALGAGVSGTLSMESTFPLPDGPGTNWQSNGVNFQNYGNLSYSGQRWPDAVAQIKASESWGEAQLSAALHAVDADGFDGFAGSPTARIGTVGWAVLAGGKLLLPSLGDGDDLQMQAVISRNAIWYSGIPEQMVNENGQTNGNGIQQFLADAFFNGAGWGTPTAGSTALVFEHHATAQITISPEASVAFLKWSHDGGLIASSMTSLIAGVDLGWAPRHQSELRSRGHVPDHRAGAPDGLCRREPLGRQHQRLCRPASDTAEFLKLCAAPAARPAAVLGQAELAHFLCGKSGFVLGFRDGNPSSRLLTINWPPTIYSNIQADIVRQFCTLGRSCILPYQAINASQALGTGTLTSAAKIMPPTSVMSAIEKRSPATKVCPRRTVSKYRMPRRALSH